MSWAAVNDITDYCRELTAIKQDFVVVGSTAFILHRLQTAKPNDLDIVVMDLNGIEGDINTYFTYSRHSTSGKRAYICEDGIAKIDIFVEDFLPDHETIRGIRVATIPALYDYYHNLLPKVAEHWKKGILDKLNLLSYGKQRQ